MMLASVKRDDGAAAHKWKRPRADLEEKQWIWKVKVGRAG